MPVIIILGVAVLVLAIAGIAYVALNNNGDVIIGTWGQDSQQPGSGDAIIYTFYSNNKFDVHIIDQNGQILNSNSGTWSKIADNQYKLTLDGQQSAITYDPSTELLNGIMKKQSSPLQPTSKPQSEKSIIGTWQQVGTSKLLYKSSNGNFDRYLGDSITINNDGTVMTKDGFVMGQWEKNSDGQYLFYPSYQSTWGIRGKGAITIHDGQLWFEWPGTDNISGMAATIFEKR